MPDIFYLYLDSALPPSKAKKLKAYLAEHQTCCRHFEFEKKLRGKLRKQGTAAHAPARLKNKLKKKLSGR